METLRLELMTVGENCVRLKGEMSKKIIDMTISDA